MKKTIIILLILALLVFGCSKQTIIMNDAQETEIEDSNIGAREEINSPGDVKEFTIDGSSFKFSPNILTVNKGDIVRINFVNTGGKHDLRVDGYNVGTKIIDEGQSDTLEFTADRSGEFEYYCSVGEHRQIGMVGKLVVK